MKLIRCNECRDVVSLHYHTRQCECGRSKGKYQPDGLHAEIEGPCTPLGFANHDFRIACQLAAAKVGRSDIYERNGVEFTAFAIPMPCPTIKHVEDGTL